MVSSCFANSRGATYLERAREDQNCSLVDWFRELNCMMEQLTRGKALPRASLTARETAWAITLHRDSRHAIMRSYRRLSNQAFPPLTK